MLAFKDIRNFPKSSRFRTTSHTKAVRNVVHGQKVKNTDALANPEALEQYRNRPELQS